MEKVYKLKLLNEALMNMAKEDYVAREIIAYIYKLEDMVNYSKKGDKDKSLALSKTKDVLESYQRILTIFNEELKEDHNKTKLPNNFAELVILYVLKNFDKLSKDKRTKNYYNKISKLEKRLKMNFSPLLTLSIMLRTKKIIDEMLKEGKINEIEELLDVLFLSRDKHDELIYLVYYGLYDGRIINKVEVYDDEHPQRNIVNNEKVAYQLLTSEDILPDSIIKEVATDEQFKARKQATLFLISMFFNFKLNPKLEEDDLSDIIQKIFYNNISDMDSKAEFLDLDEILEQIEDDFNSANGKFNFEKEFLEIVLGDIKLRRKEDNNYGSI